MHLPLQGREAGGPGQGLRTGPVDSYVDTAVPATRGTVY